MLKIYNTFSRKKEIFKPIKQNEVHLYVCGITVYDLCHLGHARVMLVFDMLVRYLKALNYQVQYVRNITDVDDKIIARAIRDGVSIEKITADNIAAMHQDFAALDLLPPSHEPKATQYISQMMQFIQGLLAKKAAYVGKNGDVYYRIAAFSGYGELSQQDLSALRSGSRVAVAEDKQDPLDFALWKRVPAEELGWNSPWGWGRPGWHIECSTMAKELLGVQFDIHGGGNDLIFPHHENEIAQSQALNQCAMAHYWLHVGFVQVDETKMSKSLNNFTTIRALCAAYPTEVIRLFILSSHYRSPLNYTENGMQQTYQALQRLYISLRGLDLSKSPVLPVVNNSYAERFHQAMQDDLNTPEAIAVLFEGARALNKLREAASSENLTAVLELANCLKQLSGILGLLQMDPEQFLQQTSQNRDQELSAAEIEQMIAQRKKAREQREFSKADAIRQQLLEKGVVLEDSAQGTIWRRVNTTH